MDELIEIAPGMKTGLLDYQLILIDVSALKPEDFKGHPVLQAVLEALQLASKGRLVAEFDRVMDRLTAVKKDPRVKGWLRSFARYVMSVAKIRTKIGMEQIVKAFSKILSEKEANEMTKTMAEELLTQGEAKGEAKAGRKLILAFLRGKFGNIPKEIEEAVKQMNDPIALESLAARTGNCKTLDEFVAEL